ncbi:MAG TPA: glycosyltransferase family 1 protein [Microbacterium sp.]|uniref:glycosyltransferase family 4 protein n=1 Tax=unclassified Microbacterium TaxID=2609290 RepID=UPI000C4F008F|nr:MULTISPECIES: glycosyltransferase family 4 protein [unclassified Microbacterium]MBU19245.1 glycosyl transferase group 1 [Microbacterium sp.]HBS09306.1 glycosyltransferase family 1 protein [Microbacterium sp.]HBU41750.1 glycosyltransferase family 1 protein [Microbacterium sp.]
MPSRILVLAKGFPPTTGGVETYSEQVARAYLRRGLEVVVLTQTDGPQGWTDRRTPDGSLRLWNAGGGGQLTVFARMLRAALKLRQDTDLAAVHSTTWRVGLVGDMVFPGIPRVVTVHGREVLNFPPGAGIAMRRVLRKASLVLAVSQATLRVALAASRQGASPKWVVAHNGLTDEARARASLRQPTESTVRVLALCRLVPRKNIVHAVAAVASLPTATAEQLDFRIAGRGPEQSSIQSAIETAELSSHVRMLGYVPDEDVPQLYEWADIFVHPHSHTGEGSDFEGFGIAIADAMAYGCAVVSGRDGGPLDFVIDGETGLLVDGNETSEIAAALQTLIDEPSLRATLAGRGKAYALENFSWNHHIEPVVETLTREKAR